MEQDTKKTSCKDCGRPVRVAATSKYAGEALCPGCYQYWMRPVAYANRPIGIQVINRY